MGSLVLENWILLVKKHEIIFGVMVYHTKTDILIS